MMEKDVQMDFVEDFEDVARILFSPLFICDGILSQKAFTLEPEINESYISVLRPIERLQQDWTNSGISDDTFHNDTLKWTYN